MSDTLADARERTLKNKTLIEDEKGNLKRRGDTTGAERSRIFLNKWWIFIAAIVAASQATQALFSILNYFKCK